MSSSCAADGDDRDSLTRTQMAEIEQEVKATQALVGGKESIDGVLHEYSKEGTHKEFTNKAKQLCTKYASLRRVRGDGNCFYRAYLYAVCELCVGREEVAKKFALDVHAWGPKLVAVGFPESTTTDFCEQFEELADRLAKGELTAAELEEEFNGDMSDYYTVFARMITSGHLQSNSEQYTPFLTEEATVSAYCGRHVDPMFVECDHLAINALVNALRVKCRIEYLDRTESATGDNHHEIDPDASPIFDGALVTLLFRPGHYDILYTAQ